MPDEPPPQTQFSHDQYACVGPMGSKNANEFLYIENIENDSKHMPPPVQ